MNTQPGLRLELRLLELRLRLRRRCARVCRRVRRSYLKFTVSQDSQNQSFLSRSQFAKLDLYQIDALRDDNDDPLGLKKEMQGATRHFPCHVFWSKELGPSKYAVWGRRTVGAARAGGGDRDARGAARRSARSTLRLSQRAQWQRECERKVREFQLA